MKYIFLFFLIPVHFFSSLIAQFAEGHITYEISIASDNPEMQMIIGMMAGSKMEVYFTKNKARSEMNMGVMMTVTSISNTETDELLMLMGGFAGQKAIKSTLSEIAQGIDSVENTITLLNETKEIVSIVCKKALMTNSEGIETIFWYSDEIVIDKRGQTYLNPQIAGFPMEFELYNNGIKMALVATHFDQKLDKTSLDTLFVMTVPENYTLTTKEEIMDLGN
jgi:hypothetical protein